MVKDITTGNSEHNRTTQQIKKGKHVRYKLGYSDYNIHEPLDCVTVLSAVDRGFEHRSVQTKDYTIDVLLLR